MPSYTYHCSQPSCGHAFESAQTDAVTFCPRCASVAKRAWAVDLASVRVRHSPTPTPPPQKTEAAHQHGPDCGCAAYSTNWQQRLATLEAAERA